MSIFSTVILCTQSQLGDEPVLQLNIVYLSNRVHAAVECLTLIVCKVKRYTLKRYYSNFHYFFTFCNVINDNIK